MEKFSLGFGPKIFSLKKNETEYVISALPLGGYVKLAGDNFEEYTNPICLLIKTILNLK